VVQVEKTQKAVKKEQSLASQLKEEISAVNSSAQKQMQLEKEKAEATEAERALVEKSLQAERQKVTAVPLVVLIKVNCAHSQVCDACFGHCDVQSTLVHNSLAYFQYTCIAQAHRQLESLCSGVAGALLLAFCDAWLSCMQTEAMRKEAAASAEALAAEKAAKFAADAEATELKRFLDNANKALEKQREFAQRLTSDAAKVKEELAGALASRSDLIMNNQGLTQVCDHSLFQLCANQSSRLCWQE